MGWRKVLFKAYLLNLHKYISRWEWEKLKSRGEMVIPEMAEVEEVQNTGRELGAPGWL